jgi:DNA-3-methyladenine glycosylase II
MFSEKTTITAVPPFSFHLSALIFSNGDRQIRKYENGVFTQVIRTNGKLILAKLESMGTVDKPNLLLELVSEKKLTEKDLIQAKQAIIMMFNFDIDLAPFYAEVKRDKTMATLTHKLRGLRSPTTQTVFEALVDSIVEQQISLKVATTIERKMIKKFGDSMEAGGTRCFEYPSPLNLASISLEELRKCGLSGRKAEYISEISKLVTNKKLDLERFKSYNSTDDVIKELDALRGIGTWTAELTVIRSMQKWDAFPADDVGLQRIISHYYCEGKRIDSFEAQKIGDMWGRWKGLASYYLVVADILNTET